VQTIWLMALVGVAGGAAAGLAAIALLQRLRARALERRAHEAGLHFSAEDTFDVPRRCAAFALLAAGHSPQVSNVLSGRVRGLPVRAFDFRYEAGHGTRRSARHYEVVLVEAGPRSSASLAGRVLMWNRRDAALAPAAAQRPDGTLGDWSWRGDARPARWIADRCEGLAGRGLSAEVRPEGVMLWFPRAPPGRADGRQGRLRFVAGGGARRDRGDGGDLRPPGEPGAPPQNGIAQAVENTLPPC